MAFLGAGWISTAAWTQYAAVMQMRWQMLVNTSRTMRGKFEVFARVFGVGFFSIVGLAAGTGLGYAAWEMASGGNLNFLPFLLWPVLVLWQMVQVMMASYQEHVDLDLLLRFPVSFGSYMVLYLIFGLLDISTILGGVCLAGVWTGLVLALPHMLPWITVVLALFAAFNILLTRMIFAWIDRWLAQRRTREIMSMVFLFLFLGLQMLNPAFHHHVGAMPAIGERVLHTAKVVQNALPPGLAAESIRSARSGHSALAAELFGWLALYAVGTGALLGLRLRKEYRGESLGVAPRQANRAELASAQGRRPFFEASEPIGAVVEKELRYLSRSGVMLYSLVAPLVLLFLFGGNTRAGHSLGTSFALPMGVAYAFLGLTRLVYNSLGGEGAGVQLYFLSPTPFRTVMLAKNLLHIGLFCVELAFVCAIVWFRFGIPSPTTLAATFCWLLFALPVQLAAGNVLSITMAYRMTLTRMSREQGATGSGLLSLLIQLLVVGVGAGVFLPLAHLGHPELAAPVYLALAACGVFAWLRVLSNVERLALERRETLIGNLARAA